MTNQFWIDFGTRILRILRMRNLSFQPGILITLATCERPGLLQFEFKIHEKGSLTRNDRNEEIRKFCRKAMIQKIVKK